MGFDILSLKGRALRLLSQREHSRAELIKKLTPHVQDGDDLVAVLDDLQAKDFINETRVLESVVYRRSSRLGGARIRQELQAKGLPNEAIQEAVARLRDSELDRARSVWARKFARPPQTPQENAKQSRFLLTRGFSGDVVRRVLRGTVDNEGDESA